MYTEADEVAETLPILPSGSLTLAAARAAVVAAMPGEDPGGNVVANVVWSLLMRSKEYWNLKRFRGGAL